MVDRRLTVGCRMPSSRALANQEREVQVQRLGRFFKALLLSAATLMTFATVTLLIADKLYRPDAFTINQLKIKGQFQFLAPEEIQQQVFAENIGNFFSIELDQIKQRVEAIPWVKHADVRREWPHTLSVHVREHQPAVRWQTLGDISNKAADANNKTADAKTVEQWVSVSGEIISLSEPLKRHSTMLLSGTEHDSRELLSRAIRWQKQLAPSGLRVLHVSLSASQAWHLSLSYIEPGNKFELLLGRENSNQRLTRFQRLFDSQFKHAQQRLLRVDARYPDGVAVRAEALPEPAEGTVSESGFSAVEGAVKS